MRLHTSPVTPDEQVEHLSFALDLHLERLGIDTDIEVGRGAAVALLAAAVLYEGFWENLARTASSLSGLAVPTPRITVRWSLIAAYGTGGAVPPVDFDWDGEGF